MRNVHPALAIGAESPEPLGVAVLVAARIQGGECSPEPERSGRGRENTNTKGARTCSKSATPLFRGNAQKIITKIESGRSAVQLELGKRSRAARWLVKAIRYFRPDTHLV